MQTVAELRAAFPRRRKSSGRPETVVIVVGLTGELTTVYYLLVAVLFDGHLGTCKFLLISNRLSFATDFRCLREIVRLWTTQYSLALVTLRGLNGNLLASKLRLQQDVVGGGGDASRAPALINLRLRRL